jgi:hypothetical protein
LPSGEDIAACAKEANSKSKPDRAGKVGVAMHAE